jgi:hypothetical protein
MLSIWKRIARKKAIEVIEAELPGMIRQKIDEEIRSRLPKMIEQIVAEKLESTPDAPLSHSGFGWALSIALRKHWPDIDGGTAAQWLWGYVGVRFGSKGYVWTYAAAQDLARQYVEDFGEPA